MKFEDTFHEIHCDLIRCIPPYLNTLNKEQVGNALSEFIVSYVSKKYNLESEKVNVNCYEFAPGKMSVYLGISSRGKAGVYSVNMAYNKKDSDWCYHGEFA